MFSLHIHYYTAVWQVREQCALRVAKPNHDHPQPVRQCRISQALVEMIAKLKLLQSDRQCRVVQASVEACSKYQALQSARQSRVVQCLVKKPAKL